MMLGLIRHGIQKDVAIYERSGWLTKVRDSAARRDVQTKSWDMFRDEVKLIPNFAATRVQFVLFILQHS